MGGCISRLSVRREASRDDGHALEAEFATQLDLVQSSPRSSVEAQRVPGSSRDADRGTTSYGIRPARINEKLLSLGQTLERAGQAGISSDLMKYGQQVVRYMSADMQPDQELLFLDIANLHRLADSYNRRYPDLNLKSMDSPAEFLEALADRSSDSAWRAVVRLANGDMHRFAADVRIRAGAPPTVIVMEPADLYTFVTPYSRFRREALQQLGPEPQWASLESARKNRPVIA
ncbi:YopJ family acetyltransferase [Bradyrhizobium zhanjiangense]|uniref:YopJ family acetyltransferase n=1 Tax=Bradyrhizobium zhanjiangense TaxID=1325107 RepID=UPI0024C08A6D|nr:YopJ family acetyltransferase [Bradyrhizobium zhanjiangense]